MTHRASLKTGGTSTAFEYTLQNMVFPWRPRSAMPFFGAGFTMVEMVIILGILILVASIVLVSFPSLSQNIALQRSARQLALSFRKAQNMTFASREISTGVVPAGYGLYFNRGTLPNSYILFADLRDASSGVANGRYDALTDFVVGTVQFEPGISITNLVSDLGGTNQPQNILNITFPVPDARMSIQNDSASVGESAQISLTGRTQLTRNVIVRTTGQIYVQ